MAAAAARKIAYFDCFSGIAGDMALGSRPVLGWLTACDICGPPVRMKYKDRLALQLLSGLQADFGLGKLYSSRNAE